MTLNGILVDYLVTKLNEEMKNVVKNRLTTDIKCDTIDVSNEREDKNE